MSGIKVVEDEVRELMRRRRLDPGTHRVELHTLIHDVVQDYDERSLHGGLEPLGDRDVATREVMDSILGFGPLQRYLDDPSIEEIWLNEPSKVFVARGGVTELTSTILTESEVRNLVERMLKPSGRRVDLSSPFVDATLPDGSRLHVAIPDVTPGRWFVNIRKFVARVHHLDDLVKLGSLDQRAARFLTAAVEVGLNILVTGGTQAGKTTMLNCLAAAIPQSERVVSCEEVFELQLRLRDWAALQCRQPSLEGTGEIPLRRLVKEALRMRPSRILVGEVRQEESLDLLIAMNSGLPGMASLHANSAREAVVKMCTLPLLAGPNVGSQFVVPTVASAIDLVVHLDLGKDGRRQVREIAAVPGRHEGSVVELADLFVRRDGELVRGSGFPPHQDLFARAGHDLVALLGGTP